MPPEVRNPSFHKRRSERAFGMAAALAMVALIFFVVAMIVLFVGWHWAVASAFAILAMILAAKAVGNYKEATRQGRLFIQAEGSSKNET